jgi:DNA invertase Pin-like site-specific DNA recombinase
MAAAIYLRQSKDRRDKDDPDWQPGLAIDRQRKECLKLIKRKGWPEECVEYPDNDTSASAGKAREHYERMLADIEAGKTTKVAVYNLDRLHRKPVELEHFIDLADRHGVELATASGDVDLSQGEGRLFARLMGAVARHEMEAKSRRQKLAALQVAEKGEPHISPRAFGYEADGVTRREAEGAALKRAYAALLAGDSLVKITNDLRAEGFLTPSGKEVHRSFTRAVLLNARNAGIRTYTTKINGRNVTKEVGQAKWPEVVDLETFRAAEAILKNPERRKNHGTARRWLGGSLFRCGVCGSDMRVNYRVERNGPVRVYKCRKSAHLSRVADFCDQVVTEALIERLSRDDARDLLVDDTAPDLADLRQRLSAVNLRLEQIAAEWGGGGMDHKEWKAARVKAKAQQADLEAQMAHTDRAPVLADLVSAKDVRGKWNAIGLDRQRAAIDLLCTVTLLRRGPGRYETPPESVEIAWERS